MSNCIWKVDEGDRHCEYCSYRGGCERHDIAGEEKAKAERYISVISDIVGRDILFRSRDEELVWARYMVAYMLRLDGYSLPKIGELLGYDHTTILHGTRNVIEMLHHPRMYEKQMNIWTKFQESLNSQKI